MPQIGELSPGLWLASAFGGHGINTTAMAGNILAQAIVEGDDTWRLFAPFELVWAGGRLGRAAMQVFYWWFNARERFEARAARQREEEDQRVAERAAVREGEDEANVEARLGAVVPWTELPTEPALAELPADPVAAQEIASPPMDRAGSDEPIAARPPENFARADLRDVSLIEDDAERRLPAAEARPKRTV
jgi:gamma-glutamylputrescine oxidase